MGKELKVLEHNLTVDKAAWRSDDDWTMEGAKAVSDAIASAIQAGWCVVSTTVHQPFTDVMVRYRLERGGVTPSQKLQALWEEIEERDYPHVNPIARKLENLTPLIRNLEAERDRYRSALEAISGGMGHSFDAWNERVDPDGGMSITRTYERIAFVALHDQSSESEGNDAD